LLYGTSSRWKRSESLPYSLSVRALAPGKGHASRSSAGTTRRLASLARSERGPHRGKRVVKRFSHLEHRAPPPVLLRPSPSQTGTSSAPSGCRAAMSARVTLNMRAGRSSRASNFVTSPRISAEGTSAMGTVRSFRGAKPASR